MTPQAKAHEDDAHEALVKGWFSNEAMDAAAMPTASFLDIKGSALTINREKMRRRIKAWLAFVRPNADDARFVDNFILARIAALEPQLVEAQAEIAMLRKAHVIACNQRDEALARLNGAVSLDAQAVWAAADLVETVPQAETVIAFALATAHTAGLREAQRKCNEIADSPTALGDDGARRCADAIAALAALAASTPPSNLLAANKSF